MHPTVSYMQGLVDKVENNLTEDINIVELARTYHVSPWHFQRQFKALAGDTLGGYIRGRRLTEAARLLGTTKLGIIDIAFGVGFSSHEAFTRAFKSYFGQSPRDFRHNKPAVVLNEKPLLSMDMVRHLGEEINHEPEVLTTSPQLIVGLGTEIPSPFVTNDAYCESLAPTWMKLFERQAEVKNAQARRYYGVSVSQSGNFTEDTIRFIAGVPVTSLAGLPDGMVTYRFPRQLVAMFAVASVDKETVLKTINYVYGYWFPNSSYTRGEGSDYELFEESNGITDLSGSKYVIPIERK
jgi:AraC family transcriptional regulator